MAAMNTDTAYALTVKVKTVAGVATTIAFADFAKAMNRVSKEGYVTIGGVQYEVASAASVQFSFAALA